LQAARRGGDLERPEAEAATWKLNFQNDPQFKDEGFNYYQRAVGARSMEMDA
jgi:hypothetical protein